MEFDENYDSTELGKRIKAIRKKCGMTQEQLADILLLSVDSISNFENGRTTCMPEHLMKICQIFNVSADYLFFGMKKELKKKESATMEAITGMIQTCSDFDLNRVHATIQILLKKPTA